MTLQKYRDLEKRALGWPRLFPKLILEHVFAWYVFHGTRGPSSIFDL